VSGVTGADLKKRILRIMTAQAARRLDFGRRILLSAAGLMIVVTPVVFGLLNAKQTRAQSPSQEAADLAPLSATASVKPSAHPDGFIRPSILYRDNGASFTAADSSLQDLLKMAYGIEGYQILAAPDWVSSERFDTEAKAGEPVIDKLQRLGPDQSKLETQRMLQALLTDRFQMTIHPETRILPIYSLVVVEPGKLQKATGDCTPLPSAGRPLSMPDPPKLSTPGCSTFFVSMGGHLAVKNSPISQLVSFLSGFTGRTVVDKTELAGKYDIELNWTPEPGQFPPIPADMLKNMPPLPPPHANGPPLITAVEEQLGLRLEPQTGPVQIFVIDHVERPSEN
jgi:bla regulator protein BlaR1